MEEGSNQHLALIPITSMMNEVFDYNGKPVGYIMQTKASNESFDPKARGTKRLGKVDDVDGPDDIEMRSAGSLEEYHWEK